MDGDEINIRNKEERAYTSWQYEEKNKILRMLDQKKKQSRWN